MIVHSKSGCRYIGSSVNVAARLLRHRSELIAGTHPNEHLQRAWRKHGHDAFAFEQIEMVPRAELLSREQWHLDRFQPNTYNVALVVSAPMLGRKWTAAQHVVRRFQMLGHPMSDATKAKIGAARRHRKMTDAQKAILLKANLGRKASAETRAKMSAIRKGKKLYPVPDERKARISAALKGRKLSAEHIANAVAGRLRKASVCNDAV